MDQATEQRIRERAYELWVEAGRPEGSHLRFWKQAENAMAADAAAGDSTTSVPKGQSSEGG